MLYLLNKIFVRQFYASNAGFFLFFFFLFFGAVQGGLLISYHLSLMTGILSSAATLSIVLFCWALYHWKCAGFFFKIINSEEGKFLYNAQTLKSTKQYIFFTITYLGLYAPVLIYAILLSIVGFRKGYTIIASLVLLFQFLSVCLSVALIFSRLNNWITKIKLPSINLGFKKQFLLYNFYYFSIEKRSLLLVSKALSLSLLYIVLVWNKGKYDNDSFLLFYLVILLTHAILPYLAVEFLEKKLASYRNLPLSLFKIITGYIITYVILLLPEFAYTFYHADALPVELRVAYCINSICSLFLLTSFLYSDAAGRDEYLKASFVLFFFSIFALHVQAFWIWIGIQLVIAIILFINGYYKYEAAD